MLHEKFLSVVSKKMLFLKNSAEGQLLGEEGLVQFCFSLKGLGRDDRQYLHSKNKVR